MPLVRKPNQPPAQPGESAHTVLHGLASPDPDQRWAAARAAVDLEGSAAALAAALPKETDSRVREAMFTSLVRTGPPENTAALLLPMLRSDDAALRTGALDALRSSIAATHALLPRLLNDPDSDIRILACELVRSLPVEKANLALCALLASEQEINVCAAAVEVLAEVGTHESLPALAQCARRFPQASFLNFAIKIASDRIASHRTRG